MGLYRIADLNLRVTPLYDLFERLASGYAIDALPEGERVDLEVAPTQADIDAIRERNGEDLGDAYFETLVVLGKLAEFAPSRQRALVHGAVVGYRGAGYLFTAPSGTGKSTHISLWGRYLGPEVVPVNGDKPLVRLDAGGTVWAYGTPWGGKEGWQVNTSVPLRGICFVRQAPACSIRELAPGEALDQLAHQVYIPEGGQRRLVTLDIMDAMLSNVPLYDLSCDISEDAVRTSFEAFTGLDYDACAHGGTRAL